MGVALDGFPCLLPDVLAAQCAELNLPTSPWLGFANRYVSPVGFRPGYAHILLTRKSISGLSATGKYSLEFTADPSQGQFQSRTSKNMRVVGTPICVSPGVRNDEDAAFFVELADRRMDCVGVCSKRYNWRINADSTLETASTNSGTAWTWTTLLTDLWDSVGNLGTWPGLPWTPTGVPEQIDGMGCRAVDLLEDLLLLHGMGGKYDDVLDTFDIIDFCFGANSGFLTRTTAQLGLQSVGISLQKLDDAGVRLWDQEPLGDLAPSMPTYARVAFPVWSSGGTPIDTASYFYVDVANTAPAVAAISSISFSLIQDFLPCRTNQVGVSLNTANLVLRAADVAAIFFEKARVASTYPIYRIYSGIIKDTNIMPGAAFDVVCWEDTGNGPKTHVIQTGRLGFPPIFLGSPNLTGTLSTGNQPSASTLFVRNPTASTNQADPIRHAANLAPGELRDYGTGPFAGSNSATILAGGGGKSSILERIGPLRQWDSAVEARCVDGHGQRLWKAKARTQHLCFVRVTSLTKSGIYYPAIEQLIAPVTGVVTAGDVCWLYDPNTTVTAVLNSIHLCYLDGTDGAGTPVKVYVAGPGGVGNVGNVGWTIAGRTGSSTISPGDTATFNNGTVSGDAWTPDVASASLAGIVSIIAQHFAGDKTFDDDVTVTGDAAVDGATGLSVANGIACESIQIGIGSPVFPPEQLSFYSSGGTILDGWIGVFENETLRYMEFRITNDAGTQINSAYMSTTQFTLLNGRFNSGTGYQVGGVNGGSATTGGLTFSGGLYMSGSATAGGLTVGTSTITGGADLSILFDNAGVVGEITRTALGQALLDIIGTTQGQILYYNGADWVALAVGTAGQFLCTGGAAANPSWVGSANIISFLAAADAAAANTVLGLGTGDSPQFTALNIGHATDTTLARVSAGLLSIDGVTIPMPAQATTWTGLQTFNADKLGLLDTVGDHALLLSSGENLSANRTLTVIVNDAARTLTIAGTSSVNGTFSGTSSGTNTGDNSAASDTVAGIIEIATAAETASAASTTLAVVPGRVQNHPGVAKVWVKVTGAGTPAIGGSYNVSSITDLGTGYFRVNIATDMSDANYAPISDCGHSGAITFSYIVANSQIAAGSFEVATVSSGALADCDVWTAAAWGAQ